MESVLSERILGDGCRRAVPLVNRIGSNKATADGNQTKMEMR